MPRLRLDVALTLLVLVLVARGRTWRRANHHEVAGDGGGIL
jgi:hypothetical protein